jgi:prevent-host-death family protein
MLVVGLRQLKLHLSEYVGRVRKGEEVVVTLRGKPVASLVPFPRVGPPRSLEPLVANGTWRDKGRPTALPVPIHMLCGEKSGVDYVREQRR